MGFRGGWSWRLGTKSFMDDRRPQVSLPDCLLMGTGLAQANYPGADGKELRNYLRDTQVNTGRLK